MSYCIFSLAQSTTSDLHKQWAIENINNGIFDKAIDNLNNITDWTITKCFYPDSVIAFAAYANNKISSSILDSLYLYVSKELEHIGKNYFAERDYEMTLYTYKKQLTWNEIYLDTLTLNHSILLNNIGSLYHNMGDYKQAEKYTLQALKVCKSLEINNNYVTILNNLGLLYTDIGSYKKAENYLLEAIELQTNIFGRDNLDYACLLNNLGNCYLALGIYAKSEIYLTQSLQIVKSILGTIHPNYATTLNNLAKLYSDIGNYEKAEEYYIEVLNIRENTLGINHPDYAITLNNLGMLYISIGDYTKAQNHLIVSKELVPNTHPNYTIILNNLGVLYSRLKDYKTAEEYHLESLHLLQKNFGISPPFYLTSINNLATLYFEMRDFDAAYLYLGLLLHSAEKTWGKDHPNYATVLNNVGMGYAYLEKNTKAKRNLLKAMKIRKKTLGSLHPDYILSLHNLGVVYSSNESNYSKAKEYFIEASIANKFLFFSSLNYMTEQQREMYIETMGIHFESYPTFAYKYQFSSPSISTFAYDNELFRKGLLLSSTNAIRQSILESNDSVLIEQWNNLVGTKQVIMNLEERYPKSSDLAYYKHQADSLEKIITQTSAVFREAQAKRSITWETIRQNLSPNEVAIEYFTAPISKDSIMYCALLLRHNSKYPELIPLFEEKEINSYLSYGDNVVNNMYRYDRTRNVTHTILGKIIPKIHEGETIYFSPAGLLHQIAIEHLPYDNNRTMSEVYPMIRLSSTSEIVSMKQKGTSPNVKSAIYGGIFYDLDTHSLLTESRNYRSEDLVTYRAIQADTTNRGKVLYLSGTKKEAESIHSLLKKKDISSTLYIASKANEESFKSLSGQHCNIIHIGTHGFTWTDSTARKQDYFRQRLSMQMLGEYQLQKPTIDPLTRCGLLFAGSNIALSGHSKDLPEGVQDGILTAKEISLMDLRDANLVVLSACETAKGDITSEGVFGLQRAFKMAGAQTIIMSLWKVNDQATQMLMTEFYTNWIGKQQSKREAFKNAQNTVRTHFEEPEYWAGFIMLD